MGRGPERQSRSPRQETIPLRYVISYDLLTPGQNYEPLWEALRGLGAQRLLQSQWIVRRINTNAAGLRDFVGQYIDANDRLVGNVPRQPLTGPA